MSADSFSWRARAHEWIIAAVFKSARGRDMPAIARVLSEMLDRLHRKFYWRGVEAPAQPSEVWCRVGVEAASGGLPASQELHAEINGESNYDAPPDPQHKLDQHFRIGRVNIGKDHNEGRWDADGRAQRADR